MVEVTSGNIELGIRYTVSNTVDGTGYITYRTVQYTQGQSFVGQVASDTYTTSTSNMKVYGDDTVVDIINQVTVDQSDEIDPYPENVQIISQSSGEGLGDNEEVVYPENVFIEILLTTGYEANKSQVIRTFP